MIDLILVKIADAVMTAVGIRAEGPVTTVRWEYPDGTELKRIYAHPSTIERNCDYLDLMFDPPAKFDLYVDGEFVTAGLTDCEPFLFDYNVAYD